MTGRPWTEFRPGQFDRTQLGRRPEQAGLFGRSQAQQLPGQDDLFGDGPGEDGPDGSDSECLESPVTAELLAPALDLRVMPDDELAQLYTAGTDEDRAAVLAELERRDQAAARRRQRASMRAVLTEWAELSHAQFIDASSVCACRLLSRRGMAQVEAEWPRLWTGPERLARSLASEELNNYWDEHPRLTVTEWDRQRKDAARMAADAEELDALAAAPPPASPARPPRQQVPRPWHAVCLVRDPTSLKVSELPLGSFPNETRAKAACAGVARASAARAGRQPVPLAWHQQATGQSASVSRDVAFGIGRTRQAGGQQ